MHRLSFYAPHPPLRDVAIYKESDASDRDGGSSSSNVFYSDTPLAKIVAAASRASQHQDNESRRRGPSAHDADAYVDTGNSDAAPDSQLSAQHPQYAKGAIPPVAKTARTQGARESDVASAALFSARCR